MVYFDLRWLGRHGIGRFSSKLIARCEELKLTGFNLPIKPTSVFDFLLLSIRIAFKQGVYFSPGYNAPIFGLSRYIFTIHDLNHIDLSYNSNHLKRLYYKIIIRRACRRCLKVLTVSEYSRGKIIEWSGVSPEKVTNVGNGVDEAFNSLVEPAKLGCRYFLCVSNRKLHKNEPLLIKAFAQAEIESGIKLVMTGAATQELTDLIVRLGMAERIIFAGRVKDSELPGLYKGSLGLLFPSLYEGFGLPVVEAMACGVPVLTSNTTSLPEVAGDAALLVDPESIDEIRTGIKRLVTDQALREELVAKGLERVKLFSWDAVAARVQAVLDEVADKYEK